MVKNKEVLNNGEDSNKYICLYGLQKLMHGQILKQVEIILIGVTQKEWGGGNIT